MDPGSIVNWLRQNPWFDVVGAIAFVGGPLAAWFRHVRNRPRLEIVYAHEGNDADHDRKVSVESGRLGPAWPGNKVERRYRSVMVHNRGPRIATNARAFVRITARNPKCTGPSAAESPLCWANGAMAVSIAPRVGKEKLDVAFTEREFQDQRRWDCVEGKTTDGVAVMGYLATDKNVKSRAGTEEDGLCSGEFEVEVSVICDEGYSTPARFAVSTQWAILKTPDGAYTFQSAEQGGHSLVMRAVA